MRPRAKPVVRVLRALAWTGGSGLLAVAAASTAAVLDGGDRSLLVVMLAALAAWAAPLAVAGTALLGLARHRRSAVVGLLVVLGVVGVLRPFPHGNADVPAARVAAGEAVALTVMSQNTLFGQADAQQLVEAVRRERPDVLVLTELTPEIVARLTGAGLDQLLPHAYLQPAEWATGTGVWSVHPLTGGALIPGLELNGVDVRVQLPGQAVRLLGVHPSAPQSGSSGRDFAVLRDHVRRIGDGEPLVVAGDLNATQYNAPLRDLLGSRLKDAGSTRLWSWQQQTWPADPATEAGRDDAALPTLPGLPALIRIDHVLTDRTAQVLDVRTVRVSGTDHLGVVVRARLTWDDRFTTGFDARP